jgi:hypothetical protein
MATDRSARLAVPAAAALLLWPAVWNGYPIVFADTGTYLTQAIQLYAGWDRPVFYSLFMLPLHLTVSVWPVVVVQALLAAWVLWLVCRALLPDLSAIAFVGGIAVLSVCTWLPWIVSELMPDVFTPLLVLALCLLAGMQERLTLHERRALAALATFMIASQQSSLPLALVLLGVLAALPWRAWSGPSAVRAGPPSAARAGSPGPFRDAGRPLRDSRLRAETRPHRWQLMILPPALAVLGLCAVNLAAYGRFSISPFGNVFLLARVIYDGPGMTVLRRDCPTETWLLCPFLDRFPATSDDFLWTAASPLRDAGGPKAVSRDAGAIIQAALATDPMREARATLANMREQMGRFGSGDGLTPWPAEVSPAIEREFPAREWAAYRAARQQGGSLSVPPVLAHLHGMAALGGVLCCVLLLPVAVHRHTPCTGFLLAVLLVLPLGAAITGSLSAPHDRYQARIMWLPPFIAAVSLAALRRPRA